jgi:hypothetical protein
MTAAASMLLSGCGNSESTAGLAVAPMELMKKCQTNRDVAACNEAATLFVRNFPILKDRCNDGDQLACSMLPVFEADIQKLQQAVISSPKGEIK